MSTPTEEGIAAAGVVKPDPMAGYTGAKPPEDQPDPPRKCGNCDFWQRMSQNAGGGAPPEFLSTHPSEAARIQQIEGWLPEALQHYKPAR